MKYRFSTTLVAAATLASLTICIPPSWAQQPPITPASLQINAGQPGVRMSPMFYGLMTEEINYSYDGGLYAELIRNRAFKDDTNSPVHWSLVQDGGGTGSLALDTTQPLNTALDTSLKLSITTPGKRVGVANDGYWGIPVRPNTKYTASFYAKSADGFSGPLTVGIESNDGTMVYAKAQVSKLSAAWKKYTVTLKTDRVLTKKKVHIGNTPAKPGTVWSESTQVTADASSTDTRFVISAAKPGSIWLDLVSLFPPTYKNRAYGNRPDLMELMADLKPTFLRLPGGNYLEGDTIETRFDWKKTIGPIENRAGHPGPWQYRSSDGMGLLEFLNWCEDLNMEPLLAVYAGYSLKQQYVKPGPDLEPYVQDALDEIEYVTGDVTTKWGAQRAKDGHPKPFHLTYVEIGNEDQFDRSRSYDGRFTQFYDAIKAKYPKLQLIATTSVKTRKPDIIDDHFYKKADAMASDSGHYDKYDRNGTKIFVGEWASQDIDTPWRDPDKKGPTPTLNSALGDAAWMVGMERNSDIVILESYAPLFVNVNPGGRQWAVNLIGYDALNSYGSPSYYVQAMFGQYHGDTIVPATLTGGDHLYQSITRDSKSGMITVKLVNTSTLAQAVRVTLPGVASVSPMGTGITLSGTDPKDTNTLTEPTKIVPVKTKVKGLSPDFTYTFPAYSVTILQIQTK